MVGARRVGGRFGIVVVALADEVGALAIASGLDVSSMDDVHEVTRPNTPPQRRARNGFKFITRPNVPAPVVHPDAGYRCLVLARLIGKNLLQRPLRYALTGLAIVFSVAAVSAVFIFTDGLRATFDELATNIESGYDISVRPTIEFGDDFLAPSVPLDQLELALGIEGVLAVQPRVVGLGVVPIDGEREPTLAPTGPNLGVLWGSRSPNTRLFLQTGRPPVGPEEFALDIDAFEDGAYELGERYTVQVPTSMERGRTFILVGTFTFADPDENALVGPEWSHSTSQPPSISSTAAAATATSPSSSTRTRTRSR